MEKDKKETFYVSLVGPLLGYYLRAQAEDENIVRKWANAKMPGLWCSVYTQEELEKAKQRNHGRVNVIGMIVALHEEDGMLYDNYL